LASFLFLAEKPFHIPLKKIDKLVILAFVPPLVLTFFVVIFILLSRHMLYYFDDIIGKDLGFVVILQFIIYLSIVMVPVAIPLAVLLSSIITFGNLAEYFELTAIKAAGISLPRVLQPVFFLIVLITALAFFVNNSVAPKAALQTYSLLYDIKQKKPALDIREGEFYNQLPNMSIRVNKKFSDDPAALKDVLVYNHQQEDGNHDVLLADSGRMYTVLNHRYLKFEFFDATQWVDNEEQPLGQEKTGGTLTRRSFSKIETVVDLASFDIGHTSARLFEGHRAMRNQAQLQHDIDSMKQVVTQFHADLQQFSFFRFDDPASEPVTHHSTAIAANQTSLEQLQAATNNARQKKEDLTLRRTRLDDARRELVLVQFRWHQILTNALACVVMFLIGAPLGAIIKKGGLGVPFLVSIVFFILYMVIGMNGEDLAQQQHITPAVGAWLSNTILFFVGIYLLNTARKDAHLFETDFFQSMKQKLVWTFKKTV
jgi:lipopolysaccharide export system permease protein